ncbi:tubulin/FtsZ family protein [Haloarcula laminariae]|uniref:tubulin/FtsZ family protein n=1 Tax=Haloarcula laminariae TaxID=2961577 RepID=UPI0021C948B7|nr:MULTISPECIES: tubulin/FtsZ family protein [Halomicroarcula]
MRLALLGVGQAGGKVTEAFLEYADRTDSDIVVDALAVNTAKADLLGLDRIPVSNRLLIGTDRVKGHGVGADNELGAEIAADDSEVVLDAVAGMPTHEIDAFLLVAGLGGGTGSGVAPYLAKELRRRYEEPVYGLGLLPGKDEGGIYTLNAARSFQTFVREVDNLVVYDNDTMASGGDSLAGGFAKANEDLARRFGVLFAAGETDGSAVPEQVVDASEIINTLGCGGVSTFGYASSPIERKRGLFGGKGRPDTSDATPRILALVRQATLGRLTLPCEITSAERALVVVAGPPEMLSRNGVEKARTWLEEATGTMEVRGGDFPVPDADEVAAAVLLSGVSDVPRVKELQAVAIETQRSMREISDVADDRLSDLLWSGDGELKPLF